MFVDIQATNSDDTQNYRLDAAHNVTSDAARCRAGTAEGWLSSYTNLFEIGGVVVVSCARTSVNNREYRVP